MVEFLCKISFRSSDRPLKLEIVTIRIITQKEMPFRGIFAGSFDFPRIVPWKGMPFNGIIRGKF
jgi:hypothetical protein